MSLWILILTLLVGGVFAWLSENLGAHWPRRVALWVLIGDLFYFVFLVGSLPDGAFQVVPQPDNPYSWLMVSSADWIPRFGLKLLLGLDGLSLILVGLTLFLGIVSVVSSWTETRYRTGFFNANLLWTLAGVTGVFLALDMVLFFVFWEVMLVPMYLLIAIWGHEGKAYASMKFFIFTQASGLLLLVSIVTLGVLYYSANGTFSFDYFQLMEMSYTRTGTGAMFLMLGFFIAFVVKLPGFPVHTWLPDAHTQAPTAGSVILAGILLKTGAYGLVRFTVPLFPEAAMTFAPIAMGLGVAGVIYGAVLAFAQTDFKRLVAYSSVSHMGFVLLGVFAWNNLALQGAVMQMVAHGLSTAALFMVAGSLQERLHTRDMSLMGGLWSQMPRMGAVTLFFVVASLGLPGLGNFVAEFLVLVGAFAVAPVLTAIAALGLITAAVYSLILLQKAFQGESDEERSLSDYGHREMSVMLLMAAGLLWLGFYPQPVLDLAQPVLDSILQLVPQSRGGIHP
ncbi:MAG: complex I subunit 4 family protein [bacterium]